MKWLITGGCGFIGTSLIARLVSEGGHEIRVIDNLLVGSRQDLAEIARFNEISEANDWASEGAELYVADIRDGKAVCEAGRGADVIVHLAANTGVAPSVEDPCADCETNVLGTLNVLEAARANACKRVVFASSGAPLGVQTPPLHEELAPHPASPYGASKLAGEGYCSAYFHCFGVETVSLRFGNVYGPRSGHKMSAVAKFIKQAMAGQRIEIYGDGQQTRDFIYVADLVDAILKASRAADIGGETFQIATSLETTVRELCDALVSVLVQRGLPKPEVSFGENRMGDVARNFSDTTKARTLLGWEATTPLSNGLALTVDFFLEKSNWEKK